MEVCLGPPDPHCPCLVLEPPSLSPACAGIPLSQGVACPGPVTEPRLLVFLLPPSDCVPSPAVLPSSTSQATSISYSDPCALLPPCCPRCRRGLVNVSHSGTLQGLLLFLKSSSLPTGSPSRRGVAHFMFYPLHGVGLLMPISSPSWGLSLAVSSACTLFPAPVHGSCLSSCRISPRGALPGHPPSQSPVLLTLHGSDRGPLPMLLGNPLPACQPPSAVWLAQSWGPHPWGSGVLARRAAVLGFGGAGW